MKQLKSFTLLLLVLCVSAVQFTYAQAKKQPQKPVKEMPYSQYLQANPKPVKTTVAGVVGGLYTGCTTLHTACGNGDFESGLDTSQWQGAYGTWGGGDPDPSTLTEGFISGDIYDFNSHQTVVGTGTDPYAGISTTNPFNSSSTQALRLGNAYPLYGTELISKNIVVDPNLTILQFYYALVLEDPQHDSVDQPAFTVRVFDCATGNEITGVCDLGNGTNRATADRNNPFFQCADAFCSVIYRDWTRAQIDLSGYIGRKVNIQFLTKDCGLGGHFGYAYLDDLCGSGAIINPFGISLNLGETDTCGTGKICADYTLPKPVGSTTVGEAVIDLNIYQDGNLVTTVSSDTLRNDSSTYCFSVDPSALGVDASLGAFDYTLVGHFSIAGKTLSPQTVGNPPAGQISGFNNDYAVTCPSTGNAPIFDYPPTPVDGTIYNVTAGQNVTFTVKAEDTDAGNTVTLDATGLPAGSTTSVKGNTTGKTSAQSLLPVTGNPVSSTFSWTPGNSDAGTYVVQYTATDNTGLSTTTNVIISVSSFCHCDTSFQTHVGVIPKYTVQGQSPHTIYKGYGPQAVALLAAHHGGTQPLKYQWSDGNKNHLRVVSPDTTTYYSVTITDANGCTSTSGVTIYVVDVRCSTTPGNIYVCNNGQTMSVPKADVKRWLDAGAKLGMCNMPVAKAVTARGTSSIKAVTPAASSAFNAYPNPAKSTINFAWSAPAGSNARIVITDLQGRTLVTQALTTSPQGINISRLANGVYMAKLVTTSGVVATSRFVVNK